ncbi:MAG: Sir2 silent information regulator family NAD-dependent deacetylase [Lachnospiraceae bacterium]|nr:Sir2 silent information regulator family NAD-dependent deacetylase [Lachnospiraceae bacterium]
MRVDNIFNLKDVLDAADAVLVGAGAGLSASAGCVYSGERFENRFGDFIEKYGFKDMYSASFFDFPKQEEFWAFWSRMTYYERYCPVPKPRVFEDLLHLIEKKDYFVLTTNGDHIFQRMGFDKKRLFYTQGDFGLWQCKKPCHQETYDNETEVLEMFEQQRNMEIPSELIPKCPKCGGFMYPNLRGGSWFVQDEGWYQAAAAYEAFVGKHKNSKIVYLDLGTGCNTLGIIKLPFMQMTRYNKKAVYVAINTNPIYAPPWLEKQSIVIKDDIGNALQKMVELES